MKLLSRSRRLFLWAGLVLGALAVVLPAYGAPAQTPAPTEPPDPNLVWPNGGKKQPVFIYADVVTSGPNEAPVNADKFCTRRDQFVRLQRIVWRASLFDAKTMKPLTAKDVKYAYIKIAGVPNTPLRFGKHGRDIKTAPWFWTVGWTIPHDYPLGTIDFEIVVKTKKNDFGFFKQMPPASPLTVVASYP